MSEHAAVLDVGINPRAGADGRVHMVGDVDFDSVAPRVRAMLLPITTRANFCPA